MTSALITGITGQDGWYLANHLHQLGFEVWASSRTGEVTADLDFVHPTQPVDIREPKSIAEVVAKIRPQEIYHLAAQSSIPASWQSPLETAEITGLGTLHLLEAVRTASPASRVFIASSSEIFGSPEFAPQNEFTPISPVSPYGAAKAYAYHISTMYRNRYDLFVSVGILFNHESPRRPKTYVSRKISSGVAAIVRGSQSNLLLGNIESRRDWGFAGDYVRAMQLMLRTDVPGDYVIATGESHSVLDFCDIAFSRVGLDYRDYVEIDPNLLRPFETTAKIGDASRAANELGWKADVTFRELVEIMVDFDMYQLD